MLKNYKHRLKLRQRVYYHEGVAPSILFAKSRMHDRLTLYDRGRIFQRCSCGTSTRHLSEAYKMGEHVLNTFFNTQLWSSF